MNQNVTSIKKPPSILALYPKSLRVESVENSDFLNNEFTENRLLMVFYLKFLLDNFKKKLKM